MTTSEHTNTIKCVNCSASLSYDPGSTKLACQYCGAENEIQVESDGSHLAELDFDAFEREFMDDTVESQMIQCGTCSAQFEVKETEGSGECAFCCTPYVLDQAKSSRVHKPAAVLPFLVDRKTSRANFREWIDSLWWAPNALKNLKTNLRKLQGIYYPFWTYDCETQSYYTGQRGEYYYVTKTRTVTDSDGKSRTETYQERRTRWYNVSGRVFDSFDDILVPAHDSLDRTTLDELEPWALDELKPYSEQYIQGFNVLNYEVSMRDGFDRYAKPKIDDIVYETCRYDIGGDEQRVHNVNTQISEQTFKHLLLPVWVSSYKFNDELYHITINASTGEVQGERPYSWVKITLAIIAGIALIAGLITLYVYYGK